MTRTLAALAGALALGLSAPALAAPSLAAGEIVAETAQDAVHQRVIDVYARWLLSTEKGKMDVAFKDYRVEIRELDQAFFSGWRVFLVAGYYGGYRPHDPAWVLVRGEEVRAVQLFINQGAIMQGGGRLKVFGCEVEGVEGMNAAGEDMDAYIRAADRYCVALGAELHARVKEASEADREAEAQRLALILAMLQDGGSSVLLPVSEDDIPGDMMQSHPLEFSPFSVETDERGRVWMRGFWLRTAPSGTRALREFLVLADAKGLRLEVKPVGTWPAEL